MNLKHKAITEHEQKTIKYYSHDYRDMAMSQDNLKDMLVGFIESLECSHSCTSNCRKEGCNCDCGEFHF